VYGIGRLNLSGQIADRDITRALGWQPGDDLTIHGAA
jgi:hypothetical protein